MGADCVPVFFVDTEKRIVAASHAGWKGTVEDIAGVTVNMMSEKFGSDPKDIKAVIGPSICMDCYEVSEDVASRFMERYSALDGECCKAAFGSKSAQVVRPASSVFDNNPTGKYFLNLWEANRLNLLNAGLDPENIEISEYCTKCHPDMLFSHRYHGENRGVNIGFIYIV